MRRVRLIIRAGCTHVTFGEPTDSAMSMMKRPTTILSHTHNSWQSDAIQSRQHEPREAKHGSQRELRSRYVKKKLCTRMWANKYVSFDTKKNLKFMRRRRSTSKEACVADKEDRARDNSLSSEDISSKDKCSEHSTKTNGKKNKMETQACGYWVQILHSSSRAIRRTSRTKRKFSTPCDRHSEDD